MTTPEQDRREDRRPLPKAAGAALDAFVFAFAILLAVSAVGGGLSLAFTGSLVALKYLLFFGWMVLLGAGVWYLRPQKPWTDDDEGVSTGPESVTAEIGHLEATLHELPPLSYFDIPPADRLSFGARVLLTSVLMAALSLAMESVFGVCAAGVQC
jgi:hypothetical protein